METITQVSRGSGYRDIFTDGPSVYRIPDSQVPGGHDPVKGDSIELDDTGNFTFITAGQLEIAAQAKADEEAAAAAQAKADEEAAAAAAAQAKADEEAAAAAQAKADEEAAAAAQAEADAKAAAMKAAQDKGAK